MSKPAATSTSVTRNRTGSPRRCGWRSGSVRRRSRCRVRTWRTRSPTTRAPTTSRTSSSCSRHGPVARAVPRLAGAAAHPQGRWRGRPCARAEWRGSGTERTHAARRQATGVSGKPRLRCRIPWHCPAAAPGAGPRQCGDGVPDRGPGCRRGLRAVAGAVRQLRQRAGLQLLLPAAALYLHHRRSGERRRAVLLRRHRGHRQQSDRARPRAGDRGATAGAHHRGAVSVQPQAGGRGEPGRPALGHRAPDRADAEGARRHPAARGQHGRGARRLPARGHAGRRGPRRGEVELGEEPRRRPRFRHAAWRETAVHADEHRPRCCRRRRYRQRRARCRSSRRISSGCSMPCPTRRRWRSSASIWSRTWIARVWWPRPTDCAPLC